MGTYYNTDLNTRKDVKDRLLYHLEWLQNAKAAWRDVKRIRKADGTNRKIFVQNFDKIQFDIYMEKYGDTHEVKLLYGSAHVNFQRNGVWEKDYIYFDGKNAIVNKPEEIERLIAERIAYLDAEIDKTKANIIGIDSILDYVEEQIVLLRTALKLAEKTGIQWELREYILNNVDCLLGNRNR